MKYKRYSSTKREYPLYIFLGMELNPMKPIVHILGELFKIILLLAWHPFRKLLEVLVPGLKRTRHR